MEKTEKMTNVKALTYVVENFKEMPADVAEKIGNILATYSKKSASSTDRKPTEKQVANLQASAEIKQWFAENVGTRYTAGDVFKLCPACKVFESVQRVTPILTKLVGTNDLAKETTKGRSYYFAE